MSGTQEKDIDWDLILSLLIEEAVGADVSRSLRAFKQENIDGVKRVFSKGSNGLGYGVFELFFGLGCCQLRWHYRVRVCSLCLDL